MPCAVKLAFAFLDTGFPCELMSNFVFISVFRYDFGGFFLFITMNRVYAVACQVNWTFHECSLLCWRYLVEGGVELLSGLSSSDGRSDAEACGTHSPRGDQSNPPQ